MGVRTPPFSRHHAPFAFTPKIDFAIYTLSSEMVELISYVDPVADPGVQRNFPLQRRPNAKCVAEGGPPLRWVFQLRDANQRNAEWTCGRSVQSVDAVVADGFVLTGGCKVVRASLLCRKSSVALLLVGQRSENYDYTLHGKPAPRRNSGQR